MSKKVSIRWHQAEPTRSVFHLYEDCADEMVGNDEPPVYLQLDGIAVQLETSDTPGARVPLVIPRALAHELGLLLNHHP